MDPVQKKKKRKSFSVANGATAGWPWVADNYEHKCKRTMEMHWCVFIMKTEQYVLKIKLTEEMGIWPHTKVCNVVLLKQK